MGSPYHGRDLKDIHRLRKVAMKYYEENKVPIEMENALNIMFFENPQDVYGYLVNFFNKFSKPATLSKISAVPVFDGNGQITIQTDVYCTVNNLQKYISSSTIPNADIKLHLEDREKAEHLIEASVQAAVKFINSELNNKLQGIDPTAQADIDARILEQIEMKKKEEIVRLSLDAERMDILSPGLRTDEKQKKQTSKSKGGKSSASIVFIPDRPLETFPVGSEWAAAVSQAVCVCASVSRNIPIYRHIAKLCRRNGALNEFRMPLPMVTVLQCGRATTGKVMCVKEFMIVPGVKMPLEKSLHYIQSIHHHVAQTLATKFGPQVKFVNASGVLCPPLETVNQGIEILTEAISAQELTIGEDMYLAINGAAHESFDRDKVRYEVVSGQFKSPDEMVDFWADLVQKCPGIVALIDPIRGEDIEQWLNLCEKVSEKTFVFGDNFYERPGIVRENELTVTTSGIVMHIERVNTISDIIACANMFEDLNNELQIVISANNSETTDTFIVDLAVGLSARFLKIGGFYRGERSCKLNRLQCIFREMEPPLEAKEVKEVVREAEVQAENFAQEDESTAHDKGDKYQTEAITDEKKEEPPVLQTWGENENSRLKLHDPFIFPLVKRPPPPPPPDETTGDEDIDQATVDTGNVHETK